MRSWGGGKNRPVHTGPLASPCTERGRYSLVSAATKRSATGRKSGMSGRLHDEKCCKYWWYRGLMVRRGAEVEMRSKSVSRTGRAMRYRWSVLADKTGWPEKGGMITPVEALRWDEAFPLQSSSDEFPDAELSEELISSLVPPGDCPSL